MVTIKTEYVAYYRVSTQQQGRSGLGLEAQQAAVREYIKGAELLAEYTEVESGRSNNRKALHAALKMCRDNGAVLVVAKLDRLSRNVMFISSLMESKVKFICCDCPEMDEFTAHIFAAVAQREARLASQRTRAGQAAAKARGVKFGNPKADKAFMDKVRAKRQPKQYDTDLLQMIRDKRANGKTWKQIADEINTGSHRSMHNKPFSATSVWRIAQKIGYSL